MAAYYCKFCRKADANDNVMLIGQFKICRRCRKVLVPIEGDQASISEDVHLANHDVEAKLLTKEAKIFTQDRINLTLAECLNKLRIDAKNIEALFCMAKIYYTKQDLELAKMYLDKVLLLKPDFQEAIEWQTKLNPELLTKDKLKEANIDMLLERVSDLVEDKRFENAYHILMLCIEKEPNHVESRQALASVCFELGNYVQAVKQLNWLKGILPNKEYAEFNLGVAFYASEHYQRALACFREAFSLSRDPVLSSQAQEFISFILERKKN